MKTKNHTYNKLDQYEKEAFLDVLNNSNNYFLQFYGTANWNLGWKLSIQGEAVTNAIYLLPRLSNLLIKTKASFKFATNKLITSNIPEQKNKVLTIYIPNEYDVLEYAKMVHECIPLYRGGLDVAPPTSYTHYKGSIYYRNDRSENGEYIPAHNKY